MSLLLVDQGEGITLGLLVNKYVPEDLVLKLYKNNRAPADGDIETDYTEATFTGYAAKELTGASWTVTPGSPSVVQYGQQTFTSSAAQTLQSIYGYYLIQKTSLKLVWAERFTDPPWNIVNLGDIVKVTPKIQLRKIGE
jgi:hypothetical protein